MNLSIQGLQSLYINCFNNPGLLSQDTSHEVKEAFCQLLATDTEDILAVMERIYELIHGDAGLKRLMRASRAIPNGEQFWSIFKRTVQVVSSKRVKILGVNFIKTLRQTILKAIRASGKTIDALKAEDVREFFDRRSLRQITPTAALATVPQGLLVARTPRPIPIQPETATQPPEPKQQIEAPQQVAGPQLHPDMVKNHENLRHLARHYRDLRHTQPNEVEKLINDFLFFQNNQCRLLIGQGRALRDNHRRWQLENHIPQLPPNAANSSWMTYYVAARCIGNGCCYCKVNWVPYCGPASCETLSAIFGMEEDELQDQVNEVLVATYGTSNRAAIDAIREDTRQRRPRPNQNEKA